MNKITKKMLTAILSVTFSLVALGTVTFAWITLTNTATLLPIDLDVSTYGGIEVSLGNKLEMNTAYYGYFTDVKKANIVAFLQNKGYYENENNRFELKYVTYDGNDFYDMEENKITDTINSGYMTFDLTLRSQIANQYVYLTPNTSLTSTRKTWKADAEFVNAHGVHIFPGDEIPYSLANSARISFESNDTDIKVDGFIYERPEFAMESSEESFGYLLSDMDFGNANHKDGVLFEGGAIAYFNAKHRDENHKEISQAELAETKSSFINQKPIAVFNGEPDDYGFYYATISVSIWLEGWDADSINAALGETLKVNIQFTTDEPTGYTETVYAEVDAEVDGETELVPYTVSRETFASVNKIVEADFSSVPTEFTEGSKEVLTGKVETIYKDTLELYTTIKLYKVEFNLDLQIGNEVDPDKKIEITRNLLLGEGDIPYPNIPFVRGYTFVWYDKNETEFEETKLNNSNLVLKGKYVVNKYTITFQVDDESEPLVFEVNFGEQISMPEDLENGNASFAGWFTDAAYTKKFEVPDTMPANDITLYAKWFTPEED